MSPAQVVCKAFLWSESRQQRESRETDDHPRGRGPTSCFKEYEFVAPTMSGQASHHFCASSDDWHLTKQVRRTLHAGGPHTQTLRPSFENDWLRCPMALLHRLRLRALVSFPAMSGGTSALTGWDPSCCVPRYWRCAALSRKTRHTRGWQQDMTMTMTHSEKSRIHRMKAWPYRLECRDHGPTKKNLFYW